jgi:hypothetical protein
VAYYQNNALPKPVLQFSNGLNPNFLFGFQDSTTAPFQLSISSVSVNANVVTANATIFSGGGGHDYITGVAPLPYANAVMGVKGTGTANGNLNVLYTTVISSNISSVTGQGNITYTAPVLGSNITLTSDSGLIQVQPMIYPDVLKVGSSIEVAQKFSPDTNDSSRSFFVDCYFPSLPANANVVLQGASVNFDNAYSTLLNKAGTNVAAQVIGSTQTIRGVEYNFDISKFLRLSVIDATGANATVIGSLFA